MFTGPRRAVTSAVSYCDSGQSCFIQSGYSRVRGSVESSRVRASCDIVRCDVCIIERTVVSGGRGKVANNKSRRVCVFIRLTGKVNDLLIAIASSSGIVGANLMQSWTIDDGSLQVSSANILVSRGISLGVVKIWSDKCEICAGLN